MQFPRGIDLQDLVGLIVNYLCFCMYLDLALPMRESSPYRLKGMAIFIKIENLDIARDSVACFSRYFRLKLRKIFIKIEDPDISRVQRSGTHFRPLNTAFNETFIKTQDLEMLIINSIRLDVASIDFQTYRWTCMH